MVVADLAAIAAISRDVEGACAVEHAAHAAPRKVLATSVAPRSRDQVTNDESRLRPHATALDRSATIGTLAILGATGDLATRYLLPALAQLFAAGEIDPMLEVRAVGRRARSQADFRQAADAGLGEFGADIDPAARLHLLDRLTYHTADASDPGALARAIGARPAVVYLALPPSALFATIEALRHAALHPENVVVVEKPFAENQTSARRLNSLLHTVFAEDRVFRIDHFLHHQTVQNILGLRFANRLYEPLWRAEHIDRVDIVWDEALGLEGRVGYYDGTGALRDMIQNHLLQLLALVAMEPPAHLTERDLRDQKVTVLRAVRTPSLDDVRMRTVRGRYTAGTVEGRALPSYVDEVGVDPGRQTETFASVELAVDNWRWGGVPFRLRSGKALGEPRRSVEIIFRPVPHLAFGQPRDPKPNTIRLELGPDRIVLGVQVNGPGDPFTLEDVELDVEFPPQVLPAYARLLLDILRGDPTLAIRDDEAEESWRIVDPILAGWRAEAVALVDYAAGSAGPSTEFAGSA